jgi:hypothetical protein
MPFAHHCHFTAIGRPFETQPACAKLQPTIRTSEKSRHPLDLAAVLNPPDTYMHLSLHVISMTASGLGEQSPKLEIVTPQIYN